MYFKFRHRNFRKLLCNSFQQHIFIIYKSTLYNIMLNNSQDFLCTANRNIRPKSNQFHIKSTPYNIVWRSKESFIVCDCEENSDLTNIYQMNTSGEIFPIIELQQNMQRWDCFDDSLLIVNKEGDIIYVNIDNKSIDIIRKQHPGHSITVLHTQNDFITCGGFVKSLNNQNSQRIIKIWGIDYDDKLQCKSRFDTYHKKSIQASFLLNRTNLVTMSKDKTIKIFDLAHENMINNFKTNELEPLSGCQLDYNSIIYGGNKPNLEIIDKRIGKSLYQGIQINEALVQITKIMRFSDNELMMANVNHLLLLDLRNMKIIKKQKVEGETTWSIKVLNQSEFVIGNRDNFIQVWESF